MGVARSPALRTVAEESAAAKVCRFMVIAAWRRRRDEVRCLRKTLEFQVRSQLVLFCISCERFLICFFSEKSVILVS